jgi:hypothetical protein
MIVPDVLLYQIDNQKLRRFIAENFRIESILNLGNGVFHKVTRPSAIIVYSRNSRSESHKINIANLSEFDQQSLPRAISNKTNLTQISQTRISNIPGFLFVTKNTQRYDIWETVASVPHKKLGEMVDDDGIQRGVSPDLKQAFIVDNETAKREGLEVHKLRRVLTGGRHVKRYCLNSPDLWLIYTSKKDDFKTLPNIRRFISQFSERITCKEAKAGKHPLYALHRSRNERIFLKSTKLLGVATEDKIVIAPDASQVFATDGLYLFGMKEEVNPNYILAILNSKLFVLIYRLLALETGRILAQVKPAILKQLPIRTIDFTDPSDKACHDQMVQRVERMLDLHKQLAEAKVPQAKIALQGQIEATDREIDKLVYELYNLTEEKIKIVEESVG